MDVVLSSVRIYLNQTIPGLTSYINPSGFKELATRHERLFNLRLEIKNEPASVSTY